MMLSQQIERASISAATETINATKSLSRASITAAKGTLNATKSISRAGISVATGTINATSNATISLSRASISAATETINATKYAANETINATKFAANETLNATKFAANETINATMFAANGTLSVTKFAANETFNATKSISRASITAASGTLNVTKSLLHTVGDSLDTMTTVAPTVRMVTRTASASVQRRSSFSTPRRTSSSSPKRTSFTIHAANVTNIFCSELVGRETIISQFEDVTNRADEVTELEIEDLLCCTCHHDLTPVVGSLVFKNDRQWTLIRFLDSFELEDFTIWHTKVESMMQDYDRCWVHMPSPYAKEAMVFKAVISVDEGTSTSDICKKLKIIRSYQDFVSISFHGVLGAVLTPQELNSMVSWDNHILRDSFTVEVEYSWSTLATKDTAKQFLKRCINRLKNPPTTFGEDGAQEQDKFFTEQDGLAKQGKTRRASSGSLLVEAEQPKTRRASGGSLLEMCDAIESRKNYSAYRRSNTGNPTSGTQQTTADAGIKRSQTVCIGDGMSTRPQRKSGAPMPTSIRSIGGDVETPGILTELQAGSPARRGRRRSSSNSLQKIAASAGRRRMSGTSLQRTVSDCGDVLPRSRSATAIPQMVAESLSTEGKSDFGSRQVERAKSDSAGRRRRMSRSTTLSDGGSNHSPQSGSRGTGRLVRTPGGGLRRCMSVEPVNTELPKSRRKSDTLLTWEAPCAGSGNSLNSFRRHHKSDTLLNRAILEGSTTNVLDERSGNTRWASKKATKKGAGGLTGQTLAMQLRKDCKAMLREKRIAMAMAPLHEDEEQKETKGLIENNCPVGTISQDAMKRNEEKAKSRMAPRLGGLQSFNGGNGSVMNIEDLLAMRDTLETAIACMSGKDECTDEEELEGPDYDWAQGVYTQQRVKPLTSRVA